MGKVTESRVEYHTDGVSKKHNSYLYMWSIYDSPLISTEPVARYFGFRSKPYYESDYYHSSQCDKFKLKLKSATKVVFQYIEGGKIVDMATKESDTLSEFKKKFDNLEHIDDFFSENHSKGGGYYSKSDKPAKYLWEAIVAGELDKYVKEVPASELQKLHDNPKARIQTRDKDYESHINRISDETNRELGNTSHLMVHILCDYRGKGKDSIGNGNHTIPGVSKSKYPDALIKTMYIPKSVWSRIRKVKIPTFCQMLNPREKHQRIPTQETEVIKNLLTRKINDNTPIDSEINYSLYMEEPFWFSRPELDKMMNEAQRQFMSSITIDGKKYIDYKLEKNKKKYVEPLVKKYKNKNTIVSAVGSGQFKIGDQLAHIFHERDKNPKADTVVWIIYHPMPIWGEDRAAEWEKKKNHKTNKTLIDRVIKGLLGYKILYITDCPTMEDDGSSGE